MRQTNTSTPIRTDSRTQETSGNTLEQIRQRAYELYEQRGREDGHDKDDWLLAEAEVTQIIARKAAA
jgi:uncharacterized protein HemX